MAKKISREEATQSAQERAIAAEREQGSATAAAELEVLFPERSINVGGNLVIVGEISFLASLRLQMHISPIVKAIEAKIGEAGALPGYDAIIGILGEHWEATLALLQEVTGRPGEWFGELSSRDGELLLLTFWSVNAPFFYQRATTATAVAREAARLLGGERSSQPSDLMGTTAADTPSGS